MKRPGDRMTSVMIPAAFVAVAAASAVNGVYKLATGTGKKEGF